MPHSSPFLTSVTFSLRCFSEDILPLEDDLLFPEDLDFGVPDDLPFLDVAAGDRTDLRDPQDLADLGPAEEGLLDDRLEDPGHGLFDVVRELVVDLVRRISTFSFCASSWILGAGFTL